LTILRYGRTICANSVYSAVCWWLRSRLSSARSPPRRKPPGHGCLASATTPTLAGAISKTSAFGEINCLDPGGFGALTITKSISIVCGQSGIGGVLVSGTPGISVNVGATDKVVLDGLDFEGAGTGTNGVQMVGAGRLVLRNSSIRNFSAFGVSMAAIMATPTPHLLMENVLITGNAGGGINVQGAAGAANAVNIVNSLIFANTTFGLQVIGPSAVTISASTVLGQPSSIVVSGGGTVTSYGNNALGNAGAPTSTTPLQ
jgi:hypothetical protein